MFLSNFRWLFAVSLCIQLHASQPIKMRIYAYPKEVAANTTGIRISFLVYNDSHAPVKVFSGVNEFRYRLVYKMANSEPLWRRDGDSTAPIPCEMGPGHEGTSNSELRVLGPDWREAITTTFKCDQLLGELIVQGIVESKTPQARRDGVEAPDDEDVWIGEFRTPEVRISLRSQSRSERRIISKFSQKAAASGKSSDQQIDPNSAWRLYPDEILQDFPGSIFSEAILLERNFNFYEDSALQRDAIDHQLMNGSVGKSPCAAGAPPACQNKWLKRIEAPEQEMERFLGEFPNSSFRPAILFRLAFRMISRGKPDEAIPLINELLTKFPNDPYCERGLLIQQAMSAKGMWRVAGTPNCNTQR